MADVNVKRGTATAITWTIDSLAASVTAGREMTAIDDTSTKALDYLVTLKIVYPNSAPSADKCCYLFGAGYDGTNWSGSPTLTGSDAAVTFDADYTINPTSYKGPIALPVIQNKTRYYGPFSVAALHGGIVPVKWSLVIANNSGNTLSTGCTATYQAITATVA